MDKRYVCPCGLTCCDCLFYQDEIYETARRFKELLQKYGFDTFLSLLSIKKGWEALGVHFSLNKDETWNKLGRHFEAFKDMTQFMSVLDSIIEVQCKATCQEKGGCSIAGNTHQCTALSCIREKGFDGCWQCEDYTNCNKLYVLKGNYGETIDENLAIIRDQGVEGVQSRGKNYYAWQRMKKTKGNK